jgi:hypothetical protein
MLHVWGSPCYVLDPRLHDDKKISKWEPRCRQGQYLGISLEHSTTVAQVLNAHRGYVIPHYHVLHDDSFTTVPSNGIPWTGFSCLTWHALLKLGYKWYVDPDFNHSGRSIPPPMLNDGWLTVP